MKVNAPDNRLTPPCPEVTGRRRSRNLSNLRLPAIELGRYFAISVAALAVDVGLLLTLSRLIHYLWAASVGFMAGAVISYLLATRWAFAHRRFSARPRTEFAAYVLVGVIGLGLNNLVIFLAVDVFGMALLAGKAMAAATTFVFNFVLRKYALFQK